MLCLGVVVQAADRSRRPPFPVHMASHRSCPWHGMAIVRKVEGDANFRHKKTAPWRGVLKAAHRLRLERYQLAQDIRDRSSLITRASPLARSHSSRSWRAILRAVRHWPRRASRPFLAGALAGSAATREATSYEEKSVLCTVRSEGDAGAFAGAEYEEKMVSWAREFIFQSFNQQHQKGAMGRY